MIHIESVGIIYTSVKLGVIDINRDKHENSEMTIHQDITPQCQWDEANQEGAHQDITRRRLRMLFSISYALLSTTLILFVLHSIYIYI